MQEFEGEVWYSKAEMVAEVRRRGLAIDESRFEEWQKYGVMPKGRREGRGRKGVTGWWSRQQLELLCTLCKIRQEQGVRFLAPQCNLPVWV